MKARFCGRGIIASLMLAGAVMFSACDKDDDDNTSMNNYTISGNASGSQVVPTVAGSGTGSMSGTYNPNNRTFTYTTTWNGLTGAPTNGGFYMGSSGTTGTAVGTPWTFGVGTTGTGTQTGSMTLTDAQAAQLTSGGWYYSYGTATYPGGEVRGQMTAVQQ